MPVSIKHVGTIGMDGAIFALLAVAGLVRSIGPGPVRRHVRANVAGAT